MIPRVRPRERLVSPRVQGGVGLGFALLEAETVKSNVREDEEMGVTYIDGIARGAGGQEQAVRFLVDSGARYSLLPKSVWESLRLRPSREMTFVLADGATVERGVSECYLILPQGQSHSPVILGEEDDAALLGVVTLEILGLVLNPFNRTLQPMRMTQA